MMACKPEIEAGSEMKVMGGVETNEYPAIVTFGGGCTGTFVSSSTLITAAHCMELPKEFSGRQPKRVIAHPGWPLGLRQPTYQQMANDLAVLVFEEGTAPATMDFVGGSPSPGAQGTIYGFGCTQARSRVGLGVKRKADQRLSQVAGGVIIAANQAGGGCSGDSGGALVIDGKLAGVTSTSTMIPGSVTTTWADVSTAAAQQFFASAVAQGAVIPGISGSGGNADNGGNGGSDQLQNPGSGQQQSEEPSPGAGSCKAEQRDGGYFCGAFGPFTDASMLGFTCGDNGVNDLCLR